MKFLQPRNAYGKWIQKRPFSLKRFVIKYLVIAVVIVGSYAYVDAKYGTTIVVNEKVVEVVGFPPVLKRIAEAESLGDHYCTEKLVKAKLCQRGALGQVLVNSTLDVGRYAINLNHWGKWCKDKGYDIFNEQDNESCAKEIFAQHGSEPWNLSKKGWSK